MNDWSAGTSYKIADIVRRDGRLFQAVQDNSGKDPSAFSVNTTYTASGSSGTTVKVASTTGIVAGMVLTGYGFVTDHYVVSVNAGASTVTVNKAPDRTPTDGQTITFSGINYVYWQLVVPGSFWTKTWQNTYAYNVGDIAVWQNGTYVCIVSHTSSPATRPDQDTTNQFWVFYVPHARKNALNTFGDMEYYDSTTLSYKSLPIGSQTYVLRNTGGVPTWSVINVLPNVYFVSSTNGQDISTYGTSWDQPYKTIAYACNQIQNNQSYPTEIANLVANKTYATTEMIQWTLYQIANNSNGFTSQYSLNQYKAVRDAGYIIDAITYDMGRGGNSQTVAAALSFFAFNQPSVFYNSSVAQDVPYYIPMLNFLGTLLQSIVNGTTITTSYQTINGVTPVIKQQIISGSKSTNSQSAATVHLDAVEVIR